MRIVDAHHHIWRQTDLPWLLGPTQPRIFGRYDAIKRDYPMTEYIRDVEACGVTASVYVQANWAPNWFADEVAWVSATAQQTGWPHGIVGYCDMLQRDARRDLDKLAQYPLMRGIRQQLHWHRKPLYRFANSPDLARSPALHRNVGYLADYGWSFDLQIFPDQVQSALTLVDACPQVSFVLQHAGMLEDDSDAGQSHWRRQMLALAERPNVYAKLSAFGTFIHRNDPAHIAWMISETVAIFGARRCLYGSNFPIEKLWTSYGALIGAFREGASYLPESEQDAIFAGTARRVYRLQ
ncbi:MAG: amidohydrolase family protein [Hyphomicrobiaceae bacterium]